MYKITNRLDSAHQKLIVTITSLDPQLFSRRPSENEWSVAEVVHHLCLVEERVTKDLKKALAQDSPQRISFVRRFVPTSIVASRLIRVKAPKSVNPMNPPEKDVSIENFAIARNKLKELCATYGRTRLRQVVFKHPFLGEIDGVAAISFVGHHEQRHYKQIREVLRKLGVNKS